MALYRPHRGTLAAALRESTTIKNMDELNEFLTGRQGDLSVQYYTFDERLGQHTYIVKDDIGVCGFLTDVNEKEFFPNAPQEKETP